MTETDTAQKAIDAVLRGSLAFCKFLSANDTGKTGGHQSGIYIYQKYQHLLSLMNLGKKEQIRNDGFRLNGREG